MTPLAEPSADIDADIAERRPRKRRELAVAAGSALAPSLVAAAVGGFLFAGLGGRFAMFILRVTSGDRVNGIESDDFIMGLVTTDSIGLVVALT